MVRILSCGAVLHMFCAVGVQSIHAQNPNPDETFLRNRGIATNATALVKFFRDRTPKASERKSLKELVDQLGSKLFRTREKASKELLLRGEVALPYLKQAVNVGPLEVVRRAKILIAQIEEGTGPEMIASAARLLALRSPPEAADVMLNYLPAVDRDWVEDEILASLGQLLKSDMITQELLPNELKSSIPSRQAAAAFVLGRWGGLKYRALIRPLLDSSQPLVKMRAAQGLTSKQVFSRLTELQSADKSLLVTNKVKTDDVSMVAWLKDRTLSSADQNHLRRLLLQLGSHYHRKRLVAVKGLLKRGTSALPFLKEMLTHPDLEIAKRSEMCIDQITQGPGPALPNALIRALTLDALDNPQTISRNVKALLAYAPFAEDESVEEQIIAALGVLNVQKSTIHPSIFTALKDRLAGRRAAAALVVGRVGTAKEIAFVERMLSDEHFKVRFRAVQGMLAAGSKTAVPVLIDLMTEVPQEMRWRVEETLLQIAGNSFTPDPNGNATLADRQKGWKQWWNRNRDTVSVVGIADRRAYRGLLVITEYDSINGRAGGRIWETTQSGKEQWTFGNVTGPMDAQVLPSGKILVAENSGRRVTIRDKKGNITWQVTVNSNPVTAQKLPNGNIFIACYNQLMEVTPGKKTVYLHRPNPSVYTYSARKLKDGTIVCFTARGQIVHIDSKTGAIKRTLTIGQSSGWGGVDILPNGRFLIATQRLGEVKEIDIKGKVYWQFRFPGAFRATRLPNGNTAIVSMNQRKVIIVDSRGRTVQQFNCQGRPWSVRFR